MSDISCNLSNDKIKVMIVDDSALIRTILSRIIKQDQCVEIQFLAEHGEMAIEYLSRNKDIDVILLDIEMPGISGIEAITELIKIKYDIKIIMVSSLSARNAPIAVKAMSLGASDYIEKPSSKQINNGEQFKNDLLGKIRSLGLSSKNITINMASSLTKKRVTPDNESMVSDIPVSIKNHEIKIRYDRKLSYTPEALLIASSTGGPQALSTLFKGFRADFLAKMPIFITQHMPKYFTKILAKNIDDIGVCNCIEVQGGEEVKPGVAFLAKGGHHMVIKRQDSKNIIALDNSPPVNFCRPSADPMIDSAIELYGQKLLLIVLTGMGHDALFGARRVYAKGGVVLAQDEATSVVWGMPGNVAVSNIASALLPIDGIANYVMNRGM